MAEDEEEEEDQECQELFGAARGETLNFKVIKNPSLGGDKSFLGGAN